MITKHIAMRSVRKSHFGQLIDYLCNPQNKQERVGAVRVSNTCQDTVWDAVLEIQATQALNTRTTVDKTYHVLLSFQPGETPSSEVLHALEARVCGALGFGEHQRISVVHGDTDHLHVHIAINTIHPTRHNVHTPYRDYRTLGTTCKTLEQEYGLAVDNHTARKTRSQNQTDDLERHTGVESFRGWIERTCLEAMTQAPTWAALHGVLQRHGLAMKTRGNGLIVQDRHGLTVTASSIARGVSKAALERRLGTFESDPRPLERTETALIARPPVKNVGDPPPLSRQGRWPSLSSLDTISLASGPQYDPQPLFGQPIDTDDLYAQYMTEQRTVRALQQQALRQAWEKKRQALEGAKHIEKINATHRYARQTVFQTGRRQA